MPLKVNMSNEEKQPNSRYTLEFKQDAANLVLNSVDTSTHQK